MIPKQKRLLGQPENLLSFRPILGLQSEQNLEAQYFRFEKHFKECGDYLFFAKPQVPYNKSVRENWTWKTTLEGKIIPYVEMDEIAQKKFKRLLKFHELLLHQHIADHFDKKTIFKGSERKKPTLIKENYEDIKQALIAACEIPDFKYTYLVEAEGKPQRPVIRNWGLIYDKFNAPEQLIAKLNQRRGNRPPEVPNLRIIATVKDVITHKPIEKARVRLEKIVIKNLCGPNSSRNFGMKDDAGHEFLSPTNEQGIASSVPFPLPFLKDAIVILTVNHPNYEQEQVEIPLVDTLIADMETEIELYPRPKTLDINVLSKFNQQPIPLTDVAITYYDIRNKQNTTIHRVTDHNGKVFINQLYLPDGKEVTIKATPTSTFDASETSNKVRLTQQDNTTTLLLPPKPKTVKILVRNQKNNKPISKAIVYLQGGQFGTSNKQTTNKKGEVIFPNLLVPVSTSLGINASKRGLSEARQTLIIQRGDNEVILKLFSTKGKLTQKISEKPLPCGANINSQSAGDTLNEHDMGASFGAIEINYDMYAAADEMIVYNGRATEIEDSKIIGGTGGKVTYKGKIQTYFSSPDNIITIRIIASSNGSAWEYQLTCPQKVKKDQFGNPLGSNYDLGKDGMYKGQTIALLDLAHTKAVYSDLITTLKTKGFEVVYFDKNLPKSWLFALQLRKVNQLWIVAGNQEYLSSNHLKVIQQFYNRKKGLYLCLHPISLTNDGLTLAKQLLQIDSHKQRLGDTILYKQIQKNTGGITHHPITTGIEQIVEGSKLICLDSPQDTIPLLTGTDGAVSVFAYEEGGKRLVIDGNSFRLHNKECTKMAGSERLVKNVGSWLAQ